MKKYFDDSMLTSTSQLSFPTSVFRALQFADGITEFANEERN